MPLRDKLKKSDDSKAVKTDLPKWVMEGSETTKSLYFAAATEFSNIKSAIEAKKDLSVKQRKLILSSIAKAAKKDRSILNARRQPEVVDWVSRANAQLDELYALHKPKRRAKLSGEPDQNLAALRGEIKKLREERAKEFVDRVFQSNLLEERDSLAMEVLTLRRRNDELMRRVDNLQAERDTQERKISLLLLQIKKL